MSTPADQLGSGFDWGKVTGFQRPHDPFVAAASQYQEPEGVQFSDYAKSIMGGGAGLVQSAGWLAKQVGAENIGSSIEELGNNAVDFWHDGLSDAAKAEVGKQIIRRNELGDYEWGDPSFSTVGLMGAQSLLGTAAGMGVGAGLTKTLQVFANPFGRKALSVAAAAGSAAASKKLKLVDTVIGAAGFGAGEGAIGGISTGASVYDNVMNLPAEKMLDNDRYRDIYESTDDSLSELERHQYAADTVAKEASSEAGWQAGLTTALLGAPMGAYFGRILGGARLSSTLPKAIATGAAGEAAQEFGQSGAETIISNIAQQAFEPDLDTFEGALNAAVGGALAGGLLGGAFSATGVGDAKAELSEQDEVKRQKSAERVGGSLKTAAAEAANSGVPRKQVLDVVGQATAGKMEAGAAIIKIRQMTNSVRTGEPIVDAEPDTKAVVPDERPVEDTQEIQPERPTPKQTEIADIKEVKAASELIASRPKGETRESFAGDTKVNTTYQLVEADDLTASHTPDGKEVPEYPKILQPRDRSRVASREQLLDRAANLQPEMITEGPGLGGGAPLVSQSGVVESGNGRVMMMNHVYQNNPQAAAKYRDYLKANAEQFGLTAGQLKGLKKPILVRTRQDDMSKEELVSLTQAANMFSRRPRALDDTTLVEDVRVEETGEVVQIETKASTYVRRMDKRMSNIEKLRGCVSA